MAELSWVPVIETWISEGAKSNNYSTLDYVRVGDGSSSASIGTHAFFMWNQHWVNIPVGSIINRVRIRLFQSDKDWVSETSSLSNLRPCLLTDDGFWQEDTLTWNNQPTDIGDTCASITRVSTTVDTTAIDIEDAALTALIQADVDAGGAVSNYGFRLGGLSVTPASHKNASMYYTHRFTSNVVHPKLIVDFTEPDLPLLDSDPATDVTATTATANGDLTDLSLGTVTEKGFYVATGYGAYTKHIVAGGAVGPFTHALTGLTENTLYNYKAYAITEFGEGEGAQMPFTTLDVTSAAGAGGIGVSSSISGTAKVYGAGGAGGKGGVNAAGAAGAANTGAGGGGAIGTAAGGAGATGVVVVRYLTSDAVTSSPILSTESFQPSLAYSLGRLFAPYAVSDDAVKVSIASISAHANTPVVTTVEDHLAVTGQVVYISGSDAVPSINGAHAIIQTGAKTFTIVGDTHTSAGTGVGTVTYNENVGLQYTGEGYNESGWLTQSRTTFHTGSVEKEYHYISVAHEPLGNTELTMSWVIDGGAPVNGTAVATSLYETRFKIASRGYDIETTIGLRTDVGQTVSPKVKGINVVWNFVKNRMHTYYLTCMAGVNNGAWESNPDNAITFLFETASELATFEDKFVGEYVGAIDKVNYRQSPDSLEEGPSGLVELVVKEES